MEKNDSFWFNQKEQEMIWRIKGDTLIQFAKALTKEKFTSPTFTMCGANWCIECYPNGNKLLNEKHISIYVRCVSLPTHIKRLAVNYHLRFATGAGTAIPISKAFSCSKWYEHNKSFGFSRIAPANVFNEFKKIKIKIHISHSLTMKNGWIFWQLDNYYVKVLKTVSKANKSKVKRLVKSFRSPVFEMIRAYWYLEIFPRTTKIILHCNSTENHRDIYAFYGLKSKDLGINTLVTFENKQNITVVKEHHKIITVFDKYALAATDEITIGCYLWTDRISLRINTKKKFNDIRIKTIHFILHGFEWQLIYKSKEERTDLLVIGYCRQIFHVIPIDITNIIYSHCKESDIPNDDKFMIEGSMDIKLFKFPPKICGVTIRRQFECKKLSLLDNDMITFNMNDSYCDTSKKFFIADSQFKNITYIDVLCIIDIISIQTKPDTICYKLKSIIRDDAMYTVPKINELNKKCYAEILQKHKNIVNCWVDNTMKLETLLFEYDEKEINEQFVVRLYDEFIKYQQLLTQHSHRSMSAKSDIAAIILNQNALFMLLAENKIKYELVGNECISFVEQYKFVKQKRENIEMEMKQTVDEGNKMIKNNLYSDDFNHLLLQQKVNNCNDMIENENRLYVEILKKKDLKQLLNERDNENEVDYNNDDEVENEDENKEDNNVNKLREQREEYVRKTRMNKKDRNKFTMNKLNEFMGVIDDLKSGNVKNKKSGKVDENTGIQFDRES
eukprot:244451_1